MEELEIRFAEIRDTFRHFQSETLTDILDRYFGLAFSTLIENWEARNSRKERDRRSFDTSDRRQVWTKKVTKEIVTQVEARQQLDDIYSFIQVQYLTI